MRRNAKSRIGNFVLIFICFLIGFIFVFPVYWMVRSSFITVGDLYANPPIIIPTRITLDNYFSALNTIDFWNQLKNSLTITVLWVVGSVVSSSMVAYAFSRIRFKFKNLWFTLILSTMMLPSAVTLIPVYMMWYQVGALNTFIPLTVPAFFGGGAYFIFMLRQFFNTIPRELDEAAKIDGAGYWCIFLRILIPLVKPALIVVGLFSFVNSWNEFFNAIIYLTNPDLHTLTLGLYMFKGVYQSNYGAVMALATIVVIPSLIFFLIGNKYFVEGIALSGIKA